MNLLRSNFAICFSVAFISMTLVHADSTKSNKVIKPVKMTCEEFLALDDVVKPQVIYWADGFNRKGKPEELEVDTGKVNELVPVIVQECQKSPKSIFWKVVKMKPLSPFA